MLKELFGDQPYPDDVAIAVAKYYTGDIRAADRRWQYHGLCYKMNDVMVACACSAKPFDFTTDIMDISQRVRVIRMDKHWPMPSFTAYFVAQCPECKTIHWGMSKP